MRLYILLLLLLTLPPIVSYPEPSHVIVSWTPGDCAFKTYHNSAVWLGCSGYAELPGDPPIDAAIVPHNGDRVWVVGPGGVKSPSVVVQHPYWAFLPVLRRPIQRHALLPMLRYQNVSQTP